MERQEEEKEGALGFAMLCLTSTLQGRGGGECIPVLQTRKEETNEEEPSSKVTHPIHAGWAHSYLSSRLPWRPWLESGIKLSWSLKLLEQLVSFLCPAFSSWMFWRGSPSRSPAQFSVTEHRRWAGSELGSGKRGAKLVPSSQRRRGRGKQTLQKLWAVPSMRKAHLIQTQPEVAWSFSLCVQKGILRPDVQSRGDNRGVGWLVGFFGLGFIVIKSPKSICWLFSPNETLYTATEIKS